MADGSIVIDTKLDSAGVEKGISKLSSTAKSGLSKFGNIVETSMKVLVTSVAVAGTALSGLGVSSIKLASDLEEVQNVVDVTFGEGAETINKWSKSAATAFGMSELQAKKFNGTMGAMLKSMGLTDTEVLNMSQSMVGLAGDFASFYNLDSEEAFNKIRAGIAGETEPLKQLGINMSVANLEAYALTKGITKQYKEMTEAEKTTLRYNYLMSASADAQGDFARTSDSLANQLRIAKLGMQDLGGAIGTSLLPLARAATKELNKIADELKIAFNNSGFNGLVIAIGDALADIVVKIADATPKIVNGAVNLISSFISGIENNLPKIINSGGGIITSLIDGAIKILPQVANLAIKATEIFLKNLFGSKVSNEFKAFVNEAKSCFDEVRNTVEKAVKSMVIVLGKLTITLLDIGKTILPVVTNAVKFLGDNLETIIPLITAVYAGFKAYSILSTTTGLIKTMTTTWNTATAALAMHEAASRLTLVAINGGLPVTTMLVGVLTGKISLVTAAQAAWNVVMNANPIGIIIAGVAALTTGLIAYNLMQEDVYKGEERLNAANEELGNSFEKIATGIVSFHDGVKSAGSILDGFNDSIIASNEEQQNLSTRMDSVQSEITEIARTATNERRSLTESEIQRMDELFAEMQKLTQRELEIQAAYQQVVQDRAQVLADTHTGTIEEYQTYSQTLINSAEETKQAVIAKSDEQCTEEIALINAKYQALGTMGSDAYNAEIEAANNKYISLVETANKECGDTLSIIQEGYANRATELKNYTNLESELRNQEVIANATYNSSLEAEDARYREALQSGFGSELGELSRHKEAVKKIEDEYANEIAGIREEEQKNLNDNVIAQGGALLVMAKDTELYGGKTSDETEKMCNGIIGNLDKLPEETKVAMSQAMSPMLDEMQKAEPGLWAKATSIADGILSRLRKAFDEHSPSRETRKIFKYVMQGAELGLEDGKSDLNKKTDDIAEEVLKKFNELGEEAPKEIVEGLNKNSDVALNSIDQLSRDIMTTAKEKCSSYKEIGSYYILNLKAGIDSRKDEAIKATKKIVDGTVQTIIEGKTIAEKELIKINDNISKEEKKRLQEQNELIKEENKKIKQANDEMRKLFTNSGKEVTSAYEAALKDGMDKVYSVVSGQIKDITEEFQNQYDEVVRAQENMQSKLTGFGDLFKINKETGKLTLENINEQIDAIEKYDEVMAALKDKNVSDELLSKVAGLGVEEGTKYAEKLLELNETEFDSYINTWEEKQKLAREVAEKFYKDQLDTIENNFKGKIDETLNGVPDIVKNIGQQTLSGFIDGLNSEEDALKNKLLEISSMVTDTLKDAFDIHSPSRVMKDLIGKNIIKGIGTGVDAETPNLIKDVKNTMSDLVNKMKLVVAHETSKTALHFGATANYKVQDVQPVVIDKETEINQHVTIINPERTPSENARALKKVGRDLAFG
ncbi:MAG: hypothetical protein RSA29_17205 [Clostridium sp.]|uniref:hypothetical protein n=1 Tax=Clostridium sp. TaxID=1506 RepID=UPI003032A72B